MTALDRPTREQVDVALALIDELLATFLIPYDDSDPMHAGWTRAASVRADVAQQWRDRRAALVARTPQPTELSWLTGAASDETARAVADVKAEAVWLVLHMQAIGTREDMQSALRTLRLIWGDPPPVNEPAPLAVPLTPLPAVPDGEDVPPRLDAAAEALEALHSHGLGFELRQVADQLRDGEGGTPELRAAVAAALAGPTAVPS